MHTHNPHQVTHKGFTIIELLVVIVIIGLLTSIAATSYLNAQRTARDNARKTAVNSIANAVESYYAINKKFPGKQSSNTDGNVSPTVNSYPCETADGSAGAAGGGNYAYFYYPLPQTATSSSDPLQKPCNDPSRADTATTTDSGYDPTLYNPFPVWIPGLGPYLNPFPIETKYQGYDGTSTGVPYDITLGPKPGDTSNPTRTFFYRKLIGGFMVYTSLENSSTGEPNVYNDKNSPMTLPAPPYFYDLGSSGTRPVSVSNNNVYLVLH